MTHRQYSHKYYEKADKLWYFRCRSQRLFSESVAKKRNWMIRRINASVNGSIQDDAMHFDE